ncbi:unnamed protein product [Parnassius mnemosyne]|uniref:Reverse transcriptase domain-containing protein n=1 Tax=Parnassius mnemosyne TaxID=213953 RepID=A0AAV1KL31_9NEOP
MDGIYRIIRRTYKRQPDVTIIKDGDALTPEGSVELLANTFFPDDKAVDDNIDRQIIRTLVADETQTFPDDEDDPEFTISELRNTVNSFNPKKAPGPDGFTADICSRAIAANEEVFLEILNKCLELSYFPTPWKEAAVVVLRKPGKTDYAQAKSYRPIGLLSTLGKIMEKMMVKRIRWHILPRANCRQYGFIPQKCTEDALYDMLTHIVNNMRKKFINIIVSLDIEGAFDSAW